LICWTAHDLGKENAEALLAELKGEDDAFESSREKQEDKGK
jgi:hypothetical protein